MGIEGYRKHFQAHLRLTILLILAEAPGYRANNSIIHTSVESVGLPATRDQVRTELAWLEEQELVSLEHPSATMIVGSLTERGHDVATARATCPGVQRPAPKG